MGIETLLSLVSNYNPKDKELIIKAYEFARKAHAGVVRKSGEPYIIHPLAVAIILAEMHADADTIAAGLLHDCIEDVDGITAELLSVEFNPTVAFLVDGVTKFNKIDFGNNKKLADDASTKKLIEFMCEDIRILIIKLADRLHNMRTLQFHKVDKQNEIARETLDFYVRFAEMIGAYNIKLDLEDLSFYYLNTEEYKRMVRLERELIKENRSVFDDILCNIAQLLNNENVPFDVKLQVKNFYGLYQKLRIYKEPENIHDLFQVKYLLKNIKECYALRDNIKNLYPVILDKNKDYISKRKTNMYRALHTSCYVNPEQIVQFQMVTPRLDIVNSYGITAHWYQNNKTNSAASMQQDFKNLQIYRVIKEIVSSDMNAEDFYEEVRSDVLGDKVYVYTPSGEVIELPSGSTPIDFAYYIHTDLGDYYKIAKVNGKTVSPNYKLKSKDVVDIEYSKTKTPNPDILLRYATTSHAKRSIKGIKRRELKRFAN